jgi:hypothetical protein
VAAKKPPPDELIERAARLRAGGSSWAAVGKDVGRTHTAVMRWPELYRVKWAVYYAVAEQAILDDASAESVHVLRQQLRSKDERSSRDAAGKLLRTRERAAESDGPAVAPETLALAQYLDGLSDADLDALAERLAPRCGFTRIATGGHDSPPPRAA